MSFLLPSDMGRLIYGYLQSSCSEELAEEFLNTSDSMKECRKYKHIGFNARVHDRTLTQMLTEYSLISDLIFEQCNENERSHFNVVSTLQNLLKTKVSCSRMFASTDASITEPPRLENSPLHQKHNDESPPWDHCVRKSIIDSTDNISASNDSSKECIKNRMKKDEPDEKNPKILSSKRKNEKKMVICKKQKKLEELKKLAETKKDHVSGKITNTSKQVPNNGASLSQVIPERKVEDSEQITDKILTKPPEENNILELQKSVADVSITNNSLLSDLIFEQCNENERSHLNVVSTLPNLSKSKVPCSRIFASTDASIPEPSRLENSPSNQKHSGESLPWDYCLRKSIIDNTDNISASNDSSKECKKNRMKKDEPDEKNPKILSSKRKNEKKVIICKKQRKLEELKKLAETKKDHVEGKITNTSKQVPNNSASSSQVISERKVEHSEQVKDKISNKPPQENHILELQKSDADVSITNNVAVEEERVYDVPRKLTEEIVLFYRIGRN